MNINKLLDIIFKDEPVEENQNGNNIVRAFFSYRFNPSHQVSLNFAEGFNKDGWEQFETGQEAPYFGVWINYKELKTLTYAEGDWSLVTCESDTKYIDECYSMRAFYKEN